MGRRHMSFLGDGLNHVLTPDARCHGHHGSLLLLRGDEHRCLGYDFSLGAGDETENARGVGLYLCGADENAYALSDYRGASVVVQPMDSSEEGCGVETFVSVRYFYGSGSY
jgi:hypothetical protein